MSTHTPGPWEAAGSYVRTKRTASGGGFFVADCWRSWDPANVEFAFDGSEADANARLIAAAPDLLESLRMAVKYLKGENMGSVMLPKFDAAIAKAEGR